MKPTNNIIDKNSIFNRIPIQVSNYQLQIFDSIRITFEMIDYDFKMLYYLIEEVESKNNHKKNCISISNHAWSIIDNTSRLNRLLRKIPTNDNHKILDNLNIVNSFRNTFQHLDDRIDESILDNKIPIYGIITWFRVENKRIIPRILLNGIINELNATLSIPEYNNISEDCLDVFIETTNKKSKISLNLYSLHHILIEICEVYEVSLSQSFQNKNLKPCDWSKRQDILIKVNSE